MKVKRCLCVAVLLCLIAFHCLAWSQERQVTKQECVAQVVKVVDRICLLYTSDAADDLA